MTQKLFPTTRTERQIQRLGIGPWAVTPEAAALFARRQRLRRYLTASIALPGLLALVMLARNAGHSADVRTASLNAYGFRTGLPTALFGLWVLVCAEFRRILDLLIGSSLPTRVTRSERVPVLTVLGRIRAVYFVVAVVADLAVGFAIFHEPGSDFRAYRWGFAVALACCTGSALLGIARETTRPAVAIDGVSLAIDERMRSEQAFHAMAPLTMLGYLGGFSLIPIMGAGRFGIVAACFTPALILMSGVAAAYPPWPKPGQPRWMTRLIRPIGW